MIIKIHDWGSAQPYERPTTGFPKASEVKGYVIGGDRWSSDFEEDGIDIFEVGTLHTSPKRIRDLAAKHSMNFTKYNAVENNCQKWALTLLEKLDKDLHHAAQNPRFVPLEKATFVASLVRAKMLSVASYTSTRSGTKRSGSHNAGKTMEKKPRKK